MSCIPLLGQTPCVSLVWQIGRGKEPTEWIPASVPGAVQLDWAAAQGWEPWWKGSNWRQYEGLEDEFWTYRTQIPAMSGPALLRFKGIDYTRTITLNGEVVHEGAGMFTPVELILALNEPAEVQVILHPAPKDPTAPAFNHEFRKSAKPGVSYGWDFHPRLIPLGIWDDVELIPLFAGRIHDCEAKVTLSEDLRTASISLLADTDDEEVQWEIIDPFGQSACKAHGRSVDLALLDPVLWWPHDQGSPCLYTAIAKTGSDERRIKFGIRRIRLVMHEGAWNWPDGFTKSRSHPPMTLQVNGRRIFAKGSNWVPPDVFPGQVTRERLSELLNLAKDSNMNLLRMWGGGPVQKSCFYDLCDELGIMVWQEFPLACSFYPDEPEYVSLLDQESRSIIKNLRRHPCLVLWCGGNELFNSWSGMTDQSLALRRLNANCLELDPLTPFIPTSPLDGVGHGGYTFRDPGTKIQAWTYFQNSACTAYCEFGCGGIANLETLRSIFTEEQLYPPDPDGVWEEHHAFGAWCFKETWLSRGTIDDLLGPSDSLEELVERGQLLQAEGFKGLFEEARRQKPVCSMALNWCFNEPWPTAANNSLVCWPADPKPSLAAVAQACRPSLASAKVSRFDWKLGDWFDPELWILHDCPEPLAGGVMKVWLNEKLILTWDFPDASPNANLQGPSAGVWLADLEPGRFTLRLEVAGRPELSSHYTLALMSQTC